MSGKERLYSVGDLARELQQPKHRIQYKLDRLRVEPALKIGGRRCFNVATLKVLREIFDMEKRESQLYDGVTP